METLGSQDLKGVHNLFAKAMEETVGGEIPLPDLLKSTQGEWQTAEELQTASRWVRLLDAGIGPDRFRRFIELRNPDGPDLQALIRYFAGKRPLQEEDVERLEWLLTYMYRNPFVSNGRSSTSEMLCDIQGWLRSEPPSLSLTAEALLDELVATLQDIAACQTFKELTRSSLIARGRGIKQRFKDEFAHPAVLAAVVNYNLVSGRKFEQLLSDALANAADFPVDMATREYRSAAEAFRQWSGSAAAVSAPGKKEPDPLVKPATSVPPRAAAGINILGIDTVIQEGRLLSVINELVAFARSAGRPVSSFPLRNSSLPVSPWEAQAMVMEYITERSFRADFNRTVRRAVGLLAAIQEEAAQYEAKRHNQHLWKRHIDALVYLLYCGGETLAALEEFGDDAARRGLQEKSDQLSQTAARLREKLRSVADFCRQWKEPAGSKDVAHAA